MSVHSARNDGMLAEMIRVLLSPRGVGQRVKGTFSFPNIDVVEIVHLLHLCGGILLFGRYKCMQGDHNDHAKSKRNGGGRIVLPEAAWRLWLWRFVEERRKKWSVLEDSSASRLGGIRFSLPSAAVGAAKGVWPVHLLSLMEKQRIQR
jgi:hypothetical protein